MYHLHKEKAGLCSNPGICQGFNGHGIRSQLGAHYPANLELEKGGIGDKALSGEIDIHRSRDIDGDLVDNQSDARCHQQLQMLSAMEAGFAWICASA